MGAQSRGLLIVVVTNSGDAWVIVRGSLFKKVRAWTRLGRVKFHPDVDFEAVKSVVASGCRLLS